MQKLGAEEAKPRTKAEVIEFLKNEGEIWASFVAGASEDFLSQHVSFPPGAAPPSKSRLEMIMTVKEHEMHHRGQLMLIERIIGIVPHLTRQMQERMAQREQRRSVSASGLAPVDWSSHQSRAGNRVKRTTRVQPGAVCQVAEVFGVPGSDNMAGICLSLPVEDLRLRRSVKSQSVLRPRQAPIPVFARRGTGSRYGITKCRRV